jgi:hypothetical protein
MGILRTKTIEPATGSTLTLGASGDTITVSSDSIKTNTFKDAGGNTLFTSDGAGTLSSVNSAFVPGGPILISTSTASNASSVDITSGIDSTYDEYMFVLTDINPVAAQSNFGFQVNASGQSGFNEVITSSAFGAYHRENDASTSLGYNTGGDQAQGTAMQQLMPNLGADTDESGACILHLFNPSSTTFVTHFYSTATWCNDDDPNYAWQFFVSGYINVTAAITEIRFLHSSGNFDGTIQMYGIK